jgi:hypothetical protein
MTITEQLTDRILDTMIGAEIDSDTIFEALKMTLGVVASFAVDGLEESDPAVDARVEDATRAITNLQEEIAGVINAQPKD